LSEEYFIQLLSSNFIVQNRRRLSNGRSLWLLEAIA